MSKYTPEEPIVAIATALSPSALAIIRVSGKNSIGLLSTVFSRPKTLLNTKGNTLVYGWIEDKTKACNKQKIDEVMVGVYKNPKSFTGEDMAEIFCHGGTVTVLAIYNLLQKNGFRLAEPGEFTFRSFINRKIDLTKAEAVHEIIDSKTDESRSRAAGRLAGNLSAEIEEAKKLLIDTLADIEVEVEYPEDENAISNAFNSDKLFFVQNKLSQIATTWQSEKLYQDGIRVVLAGKTNAGKSSLFNVLLKEDRAIVSDVHGTTRDWIESWISLGGIPARVFDTAGIRETKDIVEQEGVQRTHELAQEADLVLYLIDNEFELEQTEIENLQKYKAPVILVWTKIDKSSKTQTKKKQNFSFPEVFVSSKTGEGIESLMKESLAILVGKEKTERIQSGVGSLRQKAALDEALVAISQAVSSIKKELPLDAIAQDIEEALLHLGEITGEVHPDDILESIFSRFCVGK